MKPTFDARDQQILDERVAAYDAKPGPRVGDWVEFRGQLMRRISMVLHGGGIQTADGGSYYLGDGGISYSGSLYLPVPSDSLKPTRRKRIGSVWFFHHDWPGRDCGVSADMWFRVFSCDLEAPRV